MLTKLIKENAKPLNKGIIYLCITKLWSSYEDQFCNCFVFVKKVLKVNKTVNFTSKFSCILNKKVFEMKIKWFIESRFILIEEI